MRIGHGYDVHRLVPGRRFVLGGVEISYEKGLLGHSDADVLAHAIADSILGAAALGDIGSIFPDTDSNYLNADSMLLLKEVVKIVGDKGWDIGNIDATIIAQAPKLKPYIEQMRTNIAAVCNTDISNISVKATTEEGLGFTGSGEGVSAHTVCLLFNK
jgi:2-C-methyl-D-erythritol 2,4-cyclodiphosphate synthase